MEGIAARALAHLKDVIGLENPEILSVGAEAVLIKGIYAGETVVAKFRVPKNYRHKELDRYLRESRTVLETRVLSKSYLIGVSVPQVVFVAVEDGLILVEYVRGEKLKKTIENNDHYVKEYFLELGKNVGLLHSHGIIHGDLTTSNVIIREETKEPVLIDFGLSFFSTKNEDRGVDLHLFLRALESTHPNRSSEFFTEFLEGYKSVRGRQETEKVLEKVKDIRSRGRYVKERRKTYWKM